MSGHSTRSSSKPSKARTSENDQATSQKTPSGKVKPATSKATKAKKTAAGRGNAGKKAKANLLGNLSNVDINQLLLAAAGQLQRKFAQSRNHSKTDDSL
jgi:hypothetical protein